MKLKAVDHAILRLLEGADATKATPFTETLDSTCEKLGCSRLTLVRHLRALELAGLIGIVREKGETLKIFLIKSAPGVTAEVLERELCPADPGIVALLASGQITLKSTFNDLIKVLSGADNAKQN